MIKCNPSVQATRSGHCFYLPFNGANSVKIKFPALNCLQPMHDSKWNTKESNMASHIPQKNFALFLAQHSRNRAFAAGSVAQNILIAPHCLNVARKRRWS